MMQPKRPKDEPYRHINKLLKQYEHAAIFMEAEQRDAALMALQNDYGISAIRVVQPFYYAFTHNGLHTEILPDGTVLQSYRQWDIERVRREPVFFNYFHNGEGTGSGPKDCRQAFLPTSPFS